MYTDKTLKCKDCGADFVFTAGEQEFYAEKGFENEPPARDQRFLKPYLLCLRYFTLRWS